MFFHIKQLEDESRSVARQFLADMQEKHRRETPKIGGCCRFMLMIAFLDLHHFGIP